MRAAVDTSSVVSSRSTVSSERPATYFMMK
jgi:hypothetical protein